MIERNSISDTQPLKLNNANNQSYSRNNSPIFQKSDLFDQGSLSDFADVNDKLSFSNENSPKAKAIFSEKMNSQNQHLGSEKSKDFEGGLEDLLK